MFWYLNEINYYYISIILLFFGESNSKFALGPNNCENILEFSFGLIIIDFVSGAQVSKRALINSHDKRKYFPRIRFIESNVFLTTKKDFLQ